MGSMGNGSRRGATVRKLSWALVLSLTTLGAGCGTEALEPVSPAPPALFDTLEQEALSYNHLSVNGLSFNGLSFNGLSFNGLSAGGLSQASFASWFNANPTLAGEVMGYIIRCAVPEGETRTFTHVQANKTYTWPGLLGLAPGWAAGASPTVAEQQIVSACLAAHTNPFGVSVPISVHGRDAQGQVIPFTSGELSMFSRPESCFFGNLFQNQGVYAGSQNPPLNPNQSTTRACAVVDGSGMPRRACAPIVYAGSCAAMCTTDTTTGVAFLNCTKDGVTFKPLTTRVRDADLAVCGDGVCQVTESCGTSTTYNACAADCGVCP
ncbi:hypothetical protein [Corallococcus sicarius]|uniref:Uncharacterized protein n=1 Tax=Corallococcus sicarius TaxID=2316726 RepID=A0A3A8N3B6_9BACT|nr:hypothetical protein [Corallococcus sicarius]RKH38010.1 hypothetical protein D7X12_27700 [Corallococcus sicarius]